MADPNLKAYLASKYLSGAKAEAILSKTDSNGKKKRKKRKEGIESSNSGGGSGLRIADDSDSWKRKNDSDEDEDGRPQIEKVKESKFKKAKWDNLDLDGNRLEMVADGNGEMNTRPQEEGDEATDKEERPQFADEKGSSLDSISQDALQNRLSGVSSAAGEADGPIPNPNPNKPRAGLQTREEIQASRLRREQESKEKEEREKNRIKSKEEIENELKQQETVYRDRSGRKIDLAKEEEETRKHEERRLSKEKEKKSWNRGEKQKEEDRKRRERLEEERHADFARSADDSKMNAQLREVSRSDDPMAAFLAKSRPKTGPEKPKYKGPAPPPNRFGIQPGHRWDGVDRSNGFESMMWQKINERGRNEREARVFGQEDM